MRNSLLAQIEYRFNFVTGLIVESGYLAVKLLYVALIYRTGVSVNGLSADAILLFVGVYTLLTGVYVGLFMMSNVTFVRSINDGTFDLWLVRPVSLQFAISVQRIETSLPIPDLVGGLVMIIVACTRLNLALQWTTVLVFIVLLLGGAMLMYCLMFVPLLLTFRAIRANTVNILTSGLWDFNAMPGAIYGQTALTLGTFVLPIFAATNLPPRWLLGAWSWPELIWGLTLPLIAFALTRWLFARTLRSYSSGGG